MSRDLVFDFKLETEQSPAYWWPLIFEAAGEHSFFFSAPEYEGRGYYYYGALEDILTPSPISPSLSSFKTVWDEIFLKQKEIMISFWSKQIAEFTISISVHRSPEEQGIYIRLYVEAAELTSISSEKPEEGFLLVYECAKTLFQMCQPCSGEAYWQHAGYDYAPWVSFGKRPQVPSERFSLVPNTTLMTQRLPDGNLIYLFDPIPFPEGKGWRSLSLGEQA